MVVSDEHLLSVYQWLVVGHDGHKGAIFWFLIMSGALALLALVFGYLVAAARYGPMKAGDMTYRVVIGGLKELFSVSPRRIWALAWLTVRESFRRARVWVGLVVFVLILLFAGWFLDAESVNPLKLYVDFVLTATTYLVLALALFLSVFSLPNDFRSRTIYTIVTKPVYCGEIVLGRILGFTIIGTLLLVAMGVCSYLFVVRALSHTHTVSTPELKEIVGRSGKKVLEGPTGQSLRHRHTVTIGEDGQGRTDTQMGHWHEVQPSTGDESYELGPPRDLFQARVPHYGALRFRDRTGNEAAKGISVGNEWAYRSFIEGGTLASALWTFEGVTADKYPEGLPLEVNIRVYRSYKGIIENAIGGSILLRNPETKKESALRIFRAKDYYIDEQFIPRELTDKDGHTIDLFADLVHDGRVEIQIQCLDRAQYFGVAKADCYLRAQNGRFDLNFLKSFFGIWSQMVIVTSFGVMFSTFLSGPIAMLATINCIIMGFFAKFIVEVAKGDVPGGGPFESMIRMVMHQNVVSELESNLGNDLAKEIDKPIMYVMSNSANLLPNFANYSSVNWVASGFDIPASLVAINLIACLAYVLGVFVAGYFFLRLREVAK